MADAGHAGHADRVFATLSDTAAVAQSAVAASWSRSALRYGLDPNQAGPPRQLDRLEFERARDRLRPLIDLSRVSLDRLFQAVGEAGCCVLLTDQEGVPLERRGMPGDDLDFRNRGLWTGMVWSEACEGTNGVGTCLAEARPVTICRDQHFLTRNIGLSCTVAPIWDPRGRLIATLDVSTCRADVTPPILRLIASATIEAARRIEARCFQAAFPKARILVVPDGAHGAGGLLAVDRQDLVIGASRAARLAHGLTDARLAEPFPAEDLLLGDEAAPAEDLGAAERGVVQRALARARGNVSAAARTLGVSRATMHRKLARFGLDRGHD